MKIQRMVLAAVVIVCAWSAGAAEWYAEVETTAGSFTIALDWEKAPNGCGAFAALAEGLAGWVNPQSGRVEQGVEYYSGTAMSWVPMDGEKVALLGNRGRLFTGPDGTANVANGSGLTLKDDIRDGGGRGLAARSVAMMNNWGPDTLDGQWAVMLEDVDAFYGGKWSRIGTVASNWGVVESIAGGGRNAGTGILETPATVTGVRVWSDPPEALEAWRLGATNWPKCGMGKAAVEVKGETGTLCCGWSPKSQYAVLHCGDLTAETKSVAWMNWNDGEETAWTNISFYATETPSADGTVWFGPRHFCAVAEARYPELTLPTIKGNGHEWLTEHQWGDGSVDTYWHEMDWVEGTGTVWKATEEGGWVYDATVIGMMFLRAGAHSGELVLAEFVPSDGWTYYYDYQLGCEGEDGVGRFRLEVLGTEVWGDYAWVETGKGGSTKGDAGNIPTGEWRGKAPPPSRRGERLATMGEGGKMPPSRLRGAFPREGEAEVVIRKIR